MQVHGARALISALSFNQSWNNPGKVKIKSSIKISTINDHNIGIVLVIGKKVMFITVFNCKTMHFNAALKSLRKASLTYVNVFSFRNKEENT